MREYNTETFKQGLTKECYRIIREILRGMLITKKKITAITALAIPGAISGN